ncbi:uncharacterized protein EI97DRAFT_134426 [Westerdykella ornata]|uniref:Uncharacterized protein n=1 Tax=Westerdykella ornata TaxID=318751 RepID=A0A6A6JEE8_WESOR|nr:uncharacterized protein EI97DRAFT_134426 [Westerdykella ornata]KAF2274036.1 hypothetical protein EI97DRAFT_134426 [Westerdykella ornata]
MAREKRPALPAAYGTPGNKPPQYLIGEVSGTPETASDYSFATVNSATPINRAASSPPTTIERTGIDAALMTVVNAEASKLFGLSSGSARSTLDAARLIEHTHSFTVDAPLPPQTPSEKENNAPSSPINPGNGKSAACPANVHRGNKLAAFFSKGIEAPKPTSATATAAAVSTKRSADDAGLHAEDGSRMADAALNAKPDVAARNNSAPKQGRKTSIKPAQKPQKKLVRKSARPVNQTPPRKRQKVDLAVQHKVHDDSEGSDRDDVDMMDVEEAEAGVRSEPITDNNNNDNNDAPKAVPVSSEVKKNANNNGAKQKTAADTNEDHVLVLQTMKRSARILNPEDPVDAALIAEAEKHKDTTLYDTDDEREGDLKGNISKPELFRNVRWKDVAYDTDVEPFEPTLDFNGFVPGRFERMPDGTVRDQKSKLLTKLVDANGNRRIYRNPPPKDWNNQEALTALNKRIVQQIRRNSNVRFRRQVVPYEQFEREWILKNLNSSGKPKKGWIEFVADFNEQFEGKVFDGVIEPRPQRSVSSLTKEVDRFHDDYSQGRVPEPAADKDKRKTSSGKRKATDNVDTAEMATVSKKRKANSDGTAGPSAASKKRKVSN